MKIAVVGNCQTESLARCLAGMLPDHNVVGVFGSRSLEDIAGSDVVFAQQSALDGFGFAEHLDPESIHLFPEFYFSGFHPDVIIQDSLRSVAGMYHSSLVLHGYLSGWSETEVGTLFCGEAFDRLGFGAHWDASIAGMVEEVDRCGLNGRVLVAEWVAQGLFAHTPNHPTISVLASTARHLLRKIGTKPAALYPEKFVGDILAMHGRWPVYPEIAKARDCGSGYNFEFRKIEGQYHKEGFSLTDFIRECFVMYRQQQFTVRDIDRLTSQAEQFKGVRPGRSSTAGFPGLNLAAMQAVIRSQVEPSRIVSGETGTAEVSTGEFPFLYSLKSDVRSVFDAEHYAKNYSDVGPNPRRAFDHFIKFGVKEWRSPSPLFDVGFYAEANPESRKHEFGPLGHFLKVGRFNGCNPHPLFDLDLYLSQYPEISRGGVNPIAHYIGRGSPDRSITSKVFDAGYYAENCDDLKGMPPLLHYLKMGHGKKPHAYFDPAFYAEKHKVPAWISPLVHFVKYGGNFKLQSHSVFETNVCCDQLHEAKPNGVNPLVAYFEWQNCYVPAPVEPIIVRVADKRISRENSVSAKVVCEEDLLL